MGESQFDTLILLEVVIAAACGVLLAICAYIALRSRHSNIDTMRTKMQQSVAEEMDRAILRQSGQLRLLQDGITQSVQSLMIGQNNALERVYQQLAENRSASDVQLERVRLTVESYLERMQKDSDEKLEKMRIIVEEKLHETLEKRLCESFTSVSERLEMVHKGLGEMQNLANGVGDLKKVLSNVKTRGVWGEMQLGNILGQLLTKDQYGENMLIDPSSQDRVEYAIKLPGSNEAQPYVLLPIDAKCPLDDYYKLLTAQESGNTLESDTQAKVFERNIVKMAKSIATKYIVPPFSTDFAIMFLPIEGMYAEVLQTRGLAETLQRDYRVIVAGPTTTSALLNSLQMGFRTLAIERRSGDIWNLLDGIRTEFCKFADLLAKTKLKLEQAGQAIQAAENKTKSINKKLQHIDKGEHKYTIQQTTNPLANNAESDQNSQTNSNEEKIDKAYTKALNNL